MRQVGRSVQCRQNRRGRTAATWPYSSLDRETDPAEKACVGARSGSRRRSLRLTLTQCEAGHLFNRSSVSSRFRQSQAVSTAARPAAKGFRTNLKRVHRLPPSGARCGPRSDDAGGSEAHRGGLEIAETGETPRCRREARASAGEAMRPGFEVQGLREGDPSRGRGGEVCRGRFGRRHPVSRHFSSLKFVQAA